MRHYVCPSCGGPNRVPDDKDARLANCGRCHTKLFAGAPVEVSAAQLEAHRRSTRGAALLLDVWAPWCGPCRAMAPHFAEAARQLEPDVRLLKLNSDAHPEAAAQLGVSGIPALFLFEGGRIVARHAGLMTGAQIVAFTRQSLAAANARGDHHVH